MKSLKFSLVDLVFWLPLFMGLFMMWWRLPPGATAAIAYSALVQTLAFIWMMRVLCRSVPSGLLTASEDNCRRSDGSISEGRSHLERQALSKLHWDYLAALLVIFLAGNATAIVVYGLITWDFDAIEEVHRWYASATVLVAWALATWQFLRFCVERSLSEFASGIRRRGQQFTHLDITRLQTEYASSD